MISGGPRNFAKGKGNYCFNQEKFKDGNSMYYLWRNKCGFKPEAPNVDSTV